MPDSITIKIQTLTPLFTGGINPAVMTEIKESSLLGGLRWWYEAMLRGQGQLARDPSPEGETRCSLNQETFCKHPGETRKKRLSKARICGVCQLFGATGWRRRFALSVTDRTEFFWPQEESLNLCPPNHVHGWYLPAGKYGQFDLTLEGESWAVKEIVRLLYFLEHYGALGAKNQHGYGLFTIINREDLESKVPRPECIELQPEVPVHFTRPDLRRFAFYQHTFSDQLPRHAYPKLRAALPTERHRQLLDLAQQEKCLPLSPLLRDEWRFKSAPASLRHLQDIREHFWGYSRRNDSSRSRIAISWAYQRQGLWIIRGWSAVTMNIVDHYIDAVWQQLLDPQAIERAIGCLPETTRWEAPPDQWSQLTKLPAIPFPADSAP